MEETALPLDGCVFIKRQVFTDDRGHFTELYRAKTYERYPVLGVPQVALSSSCKNTMRGLHTSPYPKLVSCLRGKLQDVLLDVRLQSPTYGKSCTLTLDSKENTSVFIPAGVAHGFLSLEDDSQTMYVQGGEFNPARETDINLWDPKVALPWPIERSQAIISAKDAAAPFLEADSVQEKLRFNKENIPRKCNVLLIGGNGYIGSHYAKHLRLKQIDFVNAGFRLEERDKLSRWLDLCTPEFVICSAGLVGKPNIDWCNTHQAETCDINLTCQLALSEECRKRSIHCTLILTGMMYSPTPGHAYAESEPPNLGSKGEVVPVYCRLRMLLEELLNVGAYTDEAAGNVLGLRVMFPMSDDMHERSCLCKILRYPTVFSAAAPWTVLDEMVPAAVDLALRRQAGVFNWVNPGTATHDELLTRYQEVVDPSITWTSEAGKGRASAELSMDKLARLHPDIYSRIQPVGQAARDMIDRVRQARAAK